jgi:hypothetical protein
VELVDAGPSTPFFFVQVKTTPEGPHQDAEPTSASGGDLRRGPPPNGCFPGPDLRHRGP